MKSAATIVQFLFVIASLFSTFHIGESVLCTAYCDMVCNCTQNFTYQCADGTCIPLIKYRDMNFDCADKTDELVDCCPDQFKCDSSHGFAKCLSQSRLDDGITDCSDGSDESSNIERSCSQLEVFRRYECYPATGGHEKGPCIPISKILDGKFDCPEEDDEDPGNFDECALKLDKCSHNAICLDVPNDEYNCTCLPGFVGDGYTCQKQQGILSKNADKNQREDDQEEPNANLNEDGSDHENNGNGPESEEMSTTEESDEDGQVIEDNQGLISNGKTSDAKDDKSQSDLGKNLVQSNLHKYTSGNQQFGQELANAAKNIKNSMHN